jgi:hypothetical protein
MTVRALTWLAAADDPRAARDFPSCSGTRLRLKSRHWSHERSRCEAADLEQTQDSGSPLPPMPPRVLMSQRQSREDYVRGCSGELFGL